MRVWKAQQIALWEYVRKKHCGKVQIRSIMGRYKLELSYNEGAHIFKKYVLL